MEREPVLSPELVLVSPDLRELAIARAETPRWAVAPAAHAAPEPPPRARRRRFGPSALVALAVVLTAVNAASAAVLWTVGRNSGSPAYSAVPDARGVAAREAAPRVVDVAGTAASDAPAPADAESRPQVPLSVSTPPKRAGTAPARGHAPTAPARTEASTPPAPARPGGRTTSAPARRPRPTVAISADGNYVVGLTGPTCPGAPRLPWLLVAPDGTFTWTAAARDGAVSVRGRVRESGAVEAIAKYRANGCAKTVRYSGKARRAG